jgi:hypothetical protein
MAESKSRAVTFIALLEPRVGGGSRIHLPFDPDATWGRRGRHSVNGTIGGHTVRGPLRRVGHGYVMDLGPTWCREPDVAPGTTATVTLAPEGPQIDALAADIADAIAADGAARATFEALPTFYRKNFMRWIDSAKRPETRTKRIVETVAALHEGRRQR